MSTPYWHIHHEKLLEWPDNIEERIAYVRNHKPAHEVETRLRWMTPVLGELPEALGQAWQAYSQAGEAYDRAWQVYDQAWEAYRPEVEAFHALEHPGCPWDGQTLFPVVRS